MTQVDITINGRSYAITCDDGQEAHVGRLARYLDQKVTGLAKSVGQVGDARLLVMASLLVVDELVETDQALKQARNGAPPATQMPATAASPLTVSPPAGADEMLLAQTLDRLAYRIETIVTRLEND
jgi:cell division protein ZapA